MAEEMGNLAPGTFSITGCLWEGRLTSSTLNPQLNLPLIEPTFLLSKMA